MTTQKQTFSLLPLLLALSACVSAPTIAPPEPPVELQEINNSVMNRIKYVDYAKTDFREVKGNGEGNCSVIAYNVYLEAKRKGYQPEIHTCVTYGYQGHQYTTVNGWAFDVFTKSVVPEAKIQCMFKDTRPVYK